MSNYKDVIGRWTARVFLLIVTVITLFPIIWNFYSSFKTNREFIDFLGNPLSLPRSLQFENYARAWTSANIGDNFLNSVFAVVILLVVLVVCVIPCSYVLSRYTFLGSKLMLNMFMAAIFIKATYIMIPLFLQMYGIGLTNNLPAYSVLYAVTQFPFSIFLMVGFMRTIPIAYEEAAMIDGCGNFRILTQIIAPMAKPGIFTVCMLSGMAIWNEYPVALVMLTESNIMTLPVGLASLHIRAGYQTDFVALLAALVIVLIPTIFFYALGQRYLIQGVSAGGIKG
ncbi:MAG: carbohydrate ABC transporter permease [Oscillospiraceae bacterium]|nr:carbohydrate ABC transporter permease [Oscillospiraceae bacterium]